MFSQQTAAIDNFIVGTGGLKVPIGHNLGTNDPSLPRNDGSLAIDYETQQLFFVAGNQWHSVVETVTLTSVGATPNANGATITGTVLRLQPASVSFPGVITTGAQSFGGAKTFQSIVAPGTNYTATVPVSPIDNNGILVNNTLSQITPQFADENHNGILSTNTQSIGGIKQFTDGVQMLNLSNLAASPIVNTPTFFEYDSTVNGTLGDLNMSGNGGINTYNPSWHIQKCGRVVFLHIESTASLNLTGPNSLVTCPAGTIPIKFRPLSVSPREVTCLMISGGAKVQAFVQIFPNGSLIFATNGDMSTGFTVSAGVPLEGATITYFL